METWKKNGFETPVIEETLVPSTVKMILSMRTDPRTSAIPDEDKILGMMLIDRSISFDRICREAGIPRSRVETTVKKLKESGRLERAGGKRGGRWGSKGSDR
jgi:hypothetical protein